MATKALGRAVTIAATLVLSTAAADADEPSIPGHDGVHAQVSAGVGFYRVLASRDDAGGGVTFAGEVRIGGALTRRFAVGAAVLVQYAPAPAAADSVASQSFGALGVCGDHVLTKTGVHFEWVLGLGAFRESYRDSLSSPGIAPGPVVEIGVGFERPIRSGWNVGARGRVLLAQFEENSCSRCSRYPTIATTIAATLSWH